MGLLIAADLGALGDAARALAGTAQATTRTSAVPSVGDGGADGALGDFADAMNRYAAGLAEAASRGAGAMSGYVVGFHQAGG